MSDDVTDFYDDPRDPAPKSPEDEVLKKLTRAAAMVSIAASNKRNEVNGLPPTKPEYEGLTLEMATAGLDVVLLEASLFGVFDAEAAYDLGDKMIDSLRASMENEATGEEVGTDILSKD
jgi:hypothetical protein